MEQEYQRVRKKVAFLFRLASQIEIEGIEHVPAQGGFLLATNHISRLDTPLLGVVSPRRVYGLVALKYKSFPPFRWLLERGGAIWVRRTEFDRHALLESLAVLKRGEVLGVAPEGSRSPTCTLQEGKPGAAFLAARTAVPIVPVAITGTERMLEDFRRLRRMRLRVVFGKPFHLPKEGRLTTEELESATELIMRRIAELLPVVYRGFYAHLV